MAARCVATTKAGTPCRSGAVAGSAFCLMHDPTLRDVRTAASRKGGYGKSNAVRAKKAMPPAMTTAELLQQLSSVFELTLAGVVEPGVGTACGSLARTLVTIRETAEIEARLAELEATTKGWKVPR